MDETIIRCLQGRAGQETLARVRDWRDRSPENDRRYRELEEVWLLTSGGEGVGAPGPAPEVEDVVALAEAPERLPAASSVVADVVPFPERHPAASRTGDPREGRGVRSRNALAWIALAAGLAAVGFGLGRLGGGGVPAGAVEPGAEVATGPSEMTTVKLADGTAIRLGPNSTLRFVTRDPAGNQSVWLDGRAFFGVEPNDARIFTVNTPFGDAVALGTRFEVRTEADEFRVLVVQGTVRVSSAGAEIELGPGLMSTSPQGVPPEAVAVRDPEAELDWMGRTLVFRATPLASAAREIERRYGVQVEIGDPAMEPIEVTATLSDQPIEAVTAVLCEVLNADCQVEDGRIRIEPAAAGAGVPRGL